MNKKKLERRLDSLELKLDLIRSDHMGSRMDRMRLKLDSIRTFFGIDAVLGQIEPESERIEPGIADGCGRDWE